jgi:hypothetical protein
MDIAADPHFSVGQDWRWTARAERLGVKQEAEEAEFLQSEDEPRTYGEICEASEEYFDKVWYVRSLILQEKIEDGRHEPLAPDIAAGTEAARRRIEERYGAENVGPWDDWHWGFINGKLSALRWVLGSEWNFSTPRRS